MPVLDQTRALILGVMPTIAIAFFLLAGVIYATYFLAGRKSTKLRLAATASFLVGLVFVGLAVIAPLVINAAGVGLPPAPDCGAGKDAVWAGCNYLCEAPDPLAGQRCNAENYTLCRYACYGPCMEDEYGKECGATEGICAKYSVDAYGCVARINSSGCYCPCVAGGIC